MKMLRFNVKAYYDIDLGHMYFEDFKNGADGSSVQLFYGRNSVDYCVIYENEDMRYEPHFDKSQLEEMSMSDLHDISMSLDHWWNEDKKKSEIIEDLLSICNEDYYSVIYENTPYVDLSHTFEINGYSQGDYVKVMIVGNSLHSVEWLHNLFFDTPINGEIELFEFDGEEAFLDEVEEKLIFSYPINDLMQNIYHYDKAEIISNFEKLKPKNYIDEETHIYLQNKYNIMVKDSLVYYLTKKLPDNPDYR